MSGFGNKPSFTGSPTAVNQDFWNADAAVADSNVSMEARLMGAQSSPSFEINIMADNMEQL